MAKQLDICSDNPRLQCAACGRWMRLHGKRFEAVGGKIKEVAVQRFYGGCEATNGDHPFEGDVCSKCCPTKCLEKLGCNCQAPIVSSGAALMSDDCPVHGFIPSTNPVRGGP